MNYIAPQFTGSSLRDIDMAIHVEDQKLWREENVRKSWHICKAILLHAVQKLSAPWISTSLWGQSSEFLVKTTSVTITSWRQRFSQNLQEKKGLSLPDHMYIGVNKHGTWWSSQMRRSFFWLEMTRICACGPKEDEDILSRFQTTPRKDWWCGAQLVQMGCSS